MYAADANTLRRRAPFFVEAGGSLHAIKRFTTKMAMNTRRQFAWYPKIYILLTAKMARYGKAEKEISSRFFHVRITETTRSADAIIKWAKEQVS